MGPGRRLGGAKVSMRSVSVRVWVDAPLTTRVTLNMMHFDGREVGRSPRVLRCRMFRACTF
jgi:hypothetical protein